MSKTLCLILFLVCTKLLSQEPVAHFPSALIGLRLSLNPGIVIEKSIGRTTAVFLGAGFGPESITNNSGGRNAWSVNSEIGLSWLAPEWGDNYRLALSFKIKYREDDYFHNSQYRNEYESGEYYDASAQWWRQKYNYGIKVIVEFAAKNWIRPYAGIGLRYSHIRRHYITRGSAFDESRFFGNYILPTIHAGINIYPIVIKGKRYKATLQ